MIVLAACELKQQRSHDTSRQLTSRRSEQTLRICVRQAVKPHATTKSDLMDINTRPGRESLLFSDVLPAGIMRAREDSMKEGLNTAQ